MDVPVDFARWRGWFPIPTRGRGVKPVQWLLLEGNRYAVTVALLSITFSTILVVGTVWPFEMQQLLTETSAVQTLLNTLLSGIILLVSIVVSINSVVLSYDLTHVSAQEDRIEGAQEFRREIGRMTDATRSPTDPKTFLQVMTKATRKYAHEFKEATGEVDGPIVDEAEDYVATIDDTVEKLQESLEGAGGAEFGVLWIGLDTDYGVLLDRSQLLATTHDDLPEHVVEQLDRLIDSIELFMAGREYFKTLYYSREVSQFSRVLLVISLPSILITASAILAIDAHLLPSIWLFDLPPLVTFVAAAFTIAMAPYIVLTSFTLRVATVAYRTAAAGPFVVQ